MYGGLFTNDRRLTPPVETLKAVVPGPVSGVQASDSRTGQLRS